MVARRISHKSSKGLKLELGTLFLSFSLYNFSQEEWKMKEFLVKLER